MLRGTTQMNYDTMPGERVTLHEYVDEVLVEVIVDDGHGNVRTISTQFDVVDRNRRTLSPRGDIPPEHVDSIRRRIADSDYELVDPPNPARP